MFDKNIFSMATIATVMLAPIWGFALWVLLCIAVFAAVIMMWIWFISAACKRAYKWAKKLSFFKK